MWAIRSKPKQGVGDVTGLHVCWTRRCRPFGTRIIGDRKHVEYDYITPADTRFRFAIFKGMKMHSLSLVASIS